MVYNGKKKVDNVNRQHNNVNKWNMWENWWKRIIKRKKKSNVVSKVGKLGIKQGNGANKM